MLNEADFSSTLYLINASVFPPVSIFNILDFVPSKHSQFNSQAVCPELEKEFFIEQLPNSLSS